MELGSSLLIVNSLTGIFAIASYFPTIIYILVVITTLNLFLHVDLLIPFLLIYGFVLPINYLFRLLHEINADMDGEYKTAFKL